MGAFPDASQGIIIIYWQLNEDATGVEPVDIVLSYTE